MDYPASLTETTLARYSCACSEDSRFGEVFQVFIERGCPRFQSAPSPFMLRTQLLLLLFRPSAKSLNASDQRLATSP